MINIETLLSLHPLDFENAVKELLIKMGFIASTTKASGDGGVDIIAINKQPIFSGKYIIQCKQYSNGNNIGEPIIRELFGVMHAENANKGILITTSEFTEQASIFAQNKAIELINGDTLLNLINQYYIDSEDSHAVLSGQRLEEYISRFEQFTEVSSIRLEQENYKVRNKKLYMTPKEYEKNTTKMNFLAKDTDNYIEDLFTPLDFPFNIILSVGENYHNFMRKDGIEGKLLSAWNNFTSTRGYKVKNIFINEYINKSLALFTCRLLDNSYGWQKKSKFNDPYWREKSYYCALISVKELDSFENPLLIGYLLSHVFSLIY